MKYFLILSLFTCYCSSFTMKKKLLSRHENLEREIFMNAIYREYSFEILEKMLDSVTHPVNQKVLQSLLAKGMQNYCKLNAYQNTTKNEPLKPFREYSLSELESIQVN